MTKLWLVLLSLILLLPGFVAAQSEALAKTPKQHPIESLVGEDLSYDVSFLWFDRLAEGSIRLNHGEQPGTYLAVLEARTLGIAAWLSKNRVEKYQTLMEIGPDGSLRPLRHSSHSIKGDGDERRERMTSYTFDYINRQVRYQKVRNSRKRKDVLVALETEGPVYDILSGFYNLRAGVFGSFDDRQVHMPTFYRKGIEEIVVTPIRVKSKSDQKFFGGKDLLCQVLLDPSVFDTKGSDLLISFDQDRKPQRAVVKDVIGLGDVRGVLRQAVSPLNVEK